MSWLISTMAVRNQLGVNKEQAMDSEISKVEVTDINMPFSSMVWFMVKWAIASIPAIIVLWLLFVMFGGLITGLVHI